MKKIAILSALLLSACSSIVDGTKQEIEIQTVGAGCSRCELTNSKDTYTASCTPQKVTVKRAYGPLNISCYGPGIQGNTESESHINPWFFGNVLIGGLIGMGVDFATAAAWDYPDSVNVQMVRQNAAQYQNMQYAPAAPAAAANAAPSTATAAPVQTQRQPSTVQRSRYSTYSTTGYQPLYKPRYPTR